jgi:hypothetical protein
MTSQLTLLPQLPLKIMFDLEVVKIDLKKKSSCFIILNPWHTLQFLVAKSDQDVCDVGVDLVPFVAQPDVVEQGGLVEMHQAAVVINIFLWTKKYNNIIEFQTKFSLKVDSNNTWHFSDPPPPRPLPRDILPLKITKFQD